MGYSKVYQRKNKVIVHHQLGVDGKPYAEDLVITGPEGRTLLSAPDGAVGIFSYGFVVHADPVAVLFPEPPPEDGS